MTVLFCLGDDQPNIIRGGEGDDEILVRGGRDLLIGGLGADSIDGSLSDDLVIGGRLSYDKERNDDALLAILAERTRTDVDYLKRTKRIRVLASGGLNGNTYLNNHSLYADHEGDVLRGNQGKDLFAGEVDMVLDRFNGELLI
jgi:Ca2+-binding RTX toxin-like protein